MTDIYVRTRGYKIDYNVGFLLTKQLPKMPDSKYSGNIEYPTCVLEKTKEKRVYLFLSGIPSQRKDFSETTIYYDLLLEVEPWDKDEKHLIEKRQLTWLIWMWLEDVRNALREEIEEDGTQRQYVINLPRIERSNLGKLLDDTFLEDDIEKLLLLTKDRNWKNDDKDTLDKNLKKKFISEIKRPKTMPDLSKVDKHDLETWWGGIKNDDSCKQWIKLVEKLLNSEIEKGKALLLNGGTDSSVRSLFVPNGDLGVLLDREWSLSEPKLIEAQDFQEQNLIKSSWNLIQKRAKEDIEKSKKNIQQLGTILSGQD